MTNEDVTRNIWLNSISNYANVFLRLVLGLLVFRLLYQGLPREEFGFWALLWSVFGFGILLDFGFGFAAVKKVAELSVHQKWEQLSTVLSTIFFFYVGIGIFMILVICCSSHLLIDLFNVTPANREPFREMLIIFITGLAIAFPMGIFPEVLIGQQRIALTNLIFCTSSIANCVLVFVAMKMGWGLKVMIIIGLLSALIPSVVSGYYAMRWMRGVHIHLKFFSWGMIRETMSFSIYAYVGTLGNMLLAKTDQLVISTTLSVAMVALYQAGAKIGEMFGGFMVQLPDTFSPVAAHMHAKGDRGYLQRLLVDGTRFTLMIATPGYLIAAFYMEDLLRLITGDKTVLRETFWVGQVLLLWQYMTVVTQSVTKRVFMMCGHEKRLMKLGIGEALLNLGLSVGFVLYYRNIVGVAVGSLIATMFFGWVYVWPWAAREASLTGLQLARKVLWPIWLASIPLVGFVLILRHLPWIKTEPSFLVFMIHSLLAGIVAVACLWRVALTPGEREQLVGRLGKFLPRILGGTAA